MTYLTSGMGWSGTMERDPDEKDVTGERRETAPQRGEELQRPTPRVLLIDDEPSIRVALGRFFSRLGWRVTEARDGREALALLVGTPADAPQAGAPESELLAFDMVLSDVRMPGLNGLQLYEQLKAQRPDIIPRLVFSTGDIGGETTEFVRGLGRPVIQKPFRLSELREIAERLVRP